MFKYLWRVTRVLLGILVVTGLSFGAVEASSGAVATSSGLCQLAGWGVCNDAGCMASGGPCEGSTPSCEFYINEEWQPACSCNWNCQW